MMAGLNPPAGVSGGGAGSDTTALHPGETIGQVTITNSDIAATVYRLGPPGLAAGQFASYYPTDGRIFIRQADGDVVMVFDRLANNGSYTNIDRLPITSTNYVSGTWSWDNTTPNRVTINRNEVRIGGNLTVSGTSSLGSMTSMYFIASQYMQSPQYRIQSTGSTNILLSSAAYLHYQSVSNDNRIVSGPAGVKNLSSGSAIEKNKRYRQNRLRSLFLKVGVWLYGNATTPAKIALYVWNYVYADQTCLDCVSGPGCVVTYQTWESTTTNKITVYDFIPAGSYYMLTNYGGTVSIRHGSITSTQ
jgi:hypothetical protein